MIVFEIIIALIAVVLVAAALNAYDDFKKNNVEKISFKEALDLTNLPIITFSIGDRKLNFLLDTGSTSSHINKVLIDKKVIEYSPINATIEVTGMEGTVRTNNMVKLDLNLNNKSFEDDFIVNDLSAAFANIKQEVGVTLHGILGSSFFDKYKYVIDFSKYVAYSAKK